MDVMLINQILRLLGDDRRTVKETAEILDIPVSEVQAILDRGPIRMG